MGFYFEVLLFILLLLLLSGGCQPKNSPIFPFPSLKSQDLPTGEVKILTGPFQSVLNPVFRLPRDTFSSEKVDFGS